MTPTDSGRPLPKFRKGFMSAERCLAGSVHETYAAWPGETLQSFPPSHVPVGAAVISDHNWDSGGKNDFLPHAVGIGNSYG
jgi:hypothetical protein